MKTNPLIGKMLTAIYLADDKMAIRFDAGAEQIIVKVDGDCCSHTWIEHVEAPEVLIGSPVLSAQDIGSMRDDEGEHGDSVVRFYGFKITTANGVCVLDYRNESNGYYGGNLTWPNEDYFYGGVYGQNISKEEWNLLTGEPASVAAVDPVAGRHPSGPRATEDSSDSSSVASAPPDDQGT